MAASSIRSACIRSSHIRSRGRPSVSTSSSYVGPSLARDDFSPHWPMNVARSSSSDAYSCRWMPLTTRLPQNGGSGTGLSVATSERAGMSSAAVESGRPAGLTRRWPQRRQLGAGDARA